MKKKIFIIHGWTYSLERWNKICAILSSHNIEPVLLKVPGLTQPSDAVWDIDGYVKWLDGQLKDEAWPVVIGHSNGGRIALSYVIRHPAKLDQLILIDSAGIPKNIGFAKTKLLILKVLAKIGKIFSVIPSLKKTFYKVIGAQDYYNAPPNMKQTMQNMLKADQLLDLQAVKVPLTIIWGREDKITPLSDGEKLRESIDGSELFVIDGARHAPFESNPDQVANIILGKIK